MTAMYFVDTNVLLYAASNAAEDLGKRLIARQVLGLAGIGFSAQVMQEFYSAAISKKHLQMTSDEAVAVLQSVANFPVYSVSRDLVLDAIVVKQGFGL